MSYPKFPNNSNPNPSPSDPVGLAAAIQIVAMAQEGPTPRPPIAKTMAYGPSTVNSVADTGGHFRQERGKPFYRGGRPVPVVPQFKGQKIAVSNPTQAVLPTQSGGTTVSYPTGTNTVGSTRNQGGAGRFNTL